LHDDRHTARGLQQGAQRCGDAATTKEKPYMTALPTLNLRGGALLLSLLLAPALSARAQSSAPPPHPAASPAAKAEARPPSAADGVINLNTASLQELTRLPNVGPSRAQAILELRQKLGGFKKVDDIMRVKGIGRKTFRKLEPLLRLQGPTTLTQRQNPRPGSVK
jgi:competence protein ComEA